jgi:hypothetical protein
MLDGAGYPYILVPSYFEAYPERIACARLKTSHWSDPMLQTKKASGCPPAVRLAHWCRKGVLA